MTHTKYLFLLLLFLLGQHVSVSAQDGRNRTTETIVADGLAQLPAENAAVYNQVMSEIANTGSAGIEMIINMLVSADKGQNATFEYAINGVVDFAAASGNETLLKKVHNGLIEGFAKCTDKANQAFLLLQLQKVALKNDVQTFEIFLDDPYLQSYALRGLAATPASEEDLLALMESGKASKSALANLAYFKQLKGAEPLLQTWAQSERDEATLNAVYNALSACGTASSLPILKNAAKNAAFADNATGATDAYIQLLNNLSATQPALVQKAAKELTASKNAAARCAGLKLLLQTAGAKNTKEILSALKDKDIAYRNTALRFAPDYADANIFNAVGKKLSSYSLPAQADILNWLGNHHVESQIDAVTKALASKDSCVVRSAIAAAGKIGGNKALTALVAKLDGNYARETQEALLSFNGNISEGVIDALNGSAPVQQKALQLASTRHLYGTYDKVLELTRSENADVQKAAYAALAGVAQAKNFDALCDLMEKVDDNYKKDVQEAAAQAIHAETADQQYALVKKRLNTSASKTLYYPLLAQAGNRSAINTLQEGYKKAETQEAALQALLKVNNTEMLPQLLYILRNHARDENLVAARYLELAKQTEVTPEEKYLLYYQLLFLRLDAKIQNDALRALGQVYTVPSLLYAGTFLNNNDTKVRAAEAVKDIAAKNVKFQQGSLVKQYLEKAQQIFAEQTDADAGYAVDQLKGIIPNVSATGYELLTENAVVDQGKSLTSKKPYENFELYVEFCPAYEMKGEVKLRSTTQLEFKDATISFDGEATQKEVGAFKASYWTNLLYIRVENDRIEVSLNGKPIVQNGVLKADPATGVVNPEGLIEVNMTEGVLGLRHVYINPLPSTPISKLTAEEEQAGFEMLFDGRSLEKWEGNKTNYVPQDGTIYVSAKYGGSGNLYTQKKYSDFVYRFEFCFVTEGVNNGIGIRTSHDVDAAYEGMEIQVLDHDAPIYKGLMDYQQHGSVYGIIVPKHVEFGPLGTWNTEEIRAVGDHITVTVNGQVILDGDIRKACEGHNVAPDGSNHNPYTVDKKNHPGLFNKEGYISFCGHGEGVKFRNVRVLDLSKKNTKAKSKTRK